MYYEQLKERVQSAQAEVITTRSYQSEVTSLVEPVRALGERLDTVILRLGYVMAELSPNIVLERVEPLIDDTTEQVSLPGGTIQAKIYPVDARYPTEEGKLAPGYGIDYLFVPDEPTNAGEAVAIGEEATTWDPPEDTPNLGVEERYKIAKFSDAEGIPGDGPARLRYFAGIYLPERTAQVAQLEKSVLRINDALDDDSLNPWVNKLLSVRDQEQNTRARQRDLKNEEMRLWLIEEQARVFTREQERITMDSDMSPELYQAFMKYT